MPSRREFLDKALWASLSTLILQSSLWSSAAKAELLGKVPKDLPPGKSVYRIKGQVWVDGQLANEDTFISANALIKTGAKSEIIFVVGEDAHILRANSELQLSGEGTLEKGLRLFTGKVLSVFGKRESGQVTINTSTATIGIRGTGAYVESYSEYSYLCTCYGVADIQAQTDPAEKETISTIHHDAPRRILATGKQKILPAPMMNHNDEELMLVEALVGRTPPFSAVKKTYSSPRRSY